MMNLGLLGLLHLYASVINAYIVMLLKYVASVFYRNLFLPSSNIQFVSSLRTMMKILVFVSEKNPVSLLKCALEDSDLISC